MVTSPGGRPADDSPFGKPGGRGNWVSRTGGLPPYIREVAHALKRKHPEWTISHCIAVAKNSMVRFSAKSKNPRVKAAAAAANARFNANAKRARMSPNLSRPPYDNGGYLPRAPYYDGGFNTDRYTQVVLDLAFDEAAHPRIASGAGGGRFTTKGSGSGSKGKAGKKGQVLSAETRKNLRTFQRAHGLRATGSVTGGTVTRAQNAAEAAASAPARAAAAKRSTAKKTNRSRTRSTARTAQTARTSKKAQAVSIRRSAFVSQVNGLSEAQRLMLRQNLNKRGKKIPKGYVWSQGDSRLVTVATAKRAKTQRRAVKHAQRRVKRLTGLSRSTSPEGATVDLGRVPARLRTAARMQAARQGKALPGGRYPTRNRGELKDAVRAIGRNKKSSRAALVRYLKKRGKALGVRKAVANL